MTHYLAVVAAESRRLAQQLRAPGIAGAAWRVPAVDRAKESPR